MYTSFQSHNVSRGQSVSGLTDYLMKEELEVEKVAEDYNRINRNYDKDVFFNFQGNHKPNEVVKAIDNNHGKLGKKEAKFYHLTINPSKQELDHMSKSAHLVAKENRIPKEKLAEYTEKVKEKMMREYIKTAMEIYAYNFVQKHKNGTSVKPQDIMWYAKLEKERTFKHKEKEVVFNKQVDKEKKELLLEKKEKGLKEKKFNKELNKLESKYLRNDRNEIIRHGVSKNGENLHAHIIVSRLDAVNDRDNKIGLSPMTDTKKGKKVMTFYRKNGKRLSPKESSIELKNASFSLSEIKSEKLKKSDNNIINKGVNSVDLLNAKEIKLKDLNEKGLKRLGLYKEQITVNSGFERKEFIQKMEENFDHMLQYNRPKHEKFQYLNKNKHLNGKELSLKIKEALANNNITRSIKGKTKEQLFGQYGQVYSYSKKSVKMVGKLIYQASIFKKKPSKIMKAPPIMKRPEIMNITNAFSPVSKAIKLTQSITR